MILAFTIDMTTLSAADSRHSCRVFQGSACQKSPTGGLQWVDGHRFEAVDERGFALLIFKCPPSVSKREAMTRISRRGWPPGIVAFEFPLDPAPRPGALAGDSHVVNLHLLPPLTDRMCVQTVT